MSQLTAVDYSYYRRLFPTASPAYLSSATDFYHSYTSTVITYPAITYFPTCATSAGGSSPAEYSSVCSCGSSHPTPTPSNILSILSLLHVYKLHQKK
jgi:hypothetical protein